MEVQEKMRPARTRCLYATIIILALCALIFLIIMIVALVGPKKSSEPVEYEDLAAVSNPKSDKVGALNSAVRMIL